MLIEGARVNDHVLALQLDATHEILPSLGARHCPGAGL